MGRLVIALAFLLSSCTFAPQLRIGSTPQEQQTAEVYKDEYILVADGPFHPWYPGAKNTPELPAGVYSVDSFNNYNLVKVSNFEDPAIVPYDPSEDYCLINNLKNCYPNFVVRTMQEPMEPRQWSRKILDVTNESSPDINVAVLDTGVDCEHEEISCEEEYDATTATSGKGTASDENGHGTHVAGIVCANGGNGKGIAGISRGCKITAIKFLGRNGAGSVYHAIRGIEYGISREVDIINASFGGSGRLQIFQDAINKAKARGIIFIAAAGNERNDNDQNPTYPANYSNVISVASTEQNGSLSSFSNYGRDSVSLTAPGGRILSTYPGNRYVELSGTSMAAPAVSGLFAVVLQELTGTTSSKLERAEKALETVFNSAVDRGFGPTKYGRAIRVGGASPSPGCTERRCESCIEDCEKEFDCSFREQRLCRKACREKTNCRKGCRELS